MNKKIHILYLITLCSTINMPLEAVDWRAWLTNMYQRHYAPRSQVFKILAPITAVTVVGLCAAAYHKYTTSQMFKKANEEVKKWKEQQERDNQESKAQLKQEEEQLAKEQQKELERIEFEKQRLAQEQAKEDGLLPTKQEFLTNFNNNQTKRSHALSKDEPLIWHIPYTINLMLINKSLQPEQEYIFPSNKNNEYVAIALQWAQLNPKTSVNLWLDTKFTSFNAIKNTSKTIADQSKNHEHIAPILLKDVRELPQVKDNPEVFSDKTPVDFRADLLRIIAGFETLKQVKKEYFVYTDLNVKPMNQEELFDQQTQEYLQKYGLVMAKTSYLDYENSFYMLSNEIPNMLTALERAVIELNIARAYNALDGKFFTDLNRRNRCDSLKELPQIIYNSYELMFKYFYHLQKLGTLEIQDTTNPKKMYDYHSDNLKPFGLDHLDKRTLLFTPNSDQSSLLNGYHGILIPTKQVSKPMQSLTYD